MFWERKSLLTVQAAINFPESPGTATAFPVAGLGLSAMFFNGIAALLHGGTYNFLLLLAGGTVLLPLISISFMQILPPQTDHQLPPHDCQGLCSISCLQGQTRPSQGPKPQTPFRNDIPSISIESRNRAGTALDDVEESCPLLSKSSAENSEDRDIWGSGLLSHPQFWQLFFMLGLLSGIGLMTIKYVFFPSLYRKFLTLVVILEIA